MKKKNRKLLSFVMIIGFTGFIFFFPCKFQNGYTCFMDRLLASGLDQNNSYLSEELLQRYVPFGFLWWLSIGAVALGVKIYLKYRGCENGINEKASVDN